MIKFGVIGTGWIAEEFVKGTKKIDGMDFKEILSRKKETGMAFAEKFGGAEIYTDISEFAKSDIDAVYIASPNSLHYEQSKIMLEHGKHVLCEKPITTSPEDFSKLFSLAEKKNLVYTEAIMLLHMPHVDDVKRVLKSCGKVTTAHFDFSQLSSKYEALKCGKNPNIFNPKMQTGCLRDLGIYCFYAAVDFFGIPNRIFSSAGFVETGADGFGSTIFYYDDKQITLTYSKIGEDCCGSQILGDLATIRIGSISKMTDVDIIDNYANKKSVVGKYEKHVLMSYEAKSFLNYIENFEKFSDDYHKKNHEIFEVNKLIFEAKKQCKIL